MDIELQIQLLKSDIENDFNSLKELVRAKKLIDKHGATTSIMKMLDPYNELIEHKFISLESYDVLGDIPLKNINSTLAVEGIGNVITTVKDRLFGHMKESTAMVENNNKHISEVRTLANTLSKYINSLNSPLNDITGFLNSHIKGLEFHDLEHRKSICVNTLLLLKAHILKIEPSVNKVIQKLKSSGKYDSFDFISELDSVVFNLVSDFRHKIPQHDMEILGIMFTDSNHKETKSWEKISIHVKPFEEIRTALRIGTISELGYSANNIHDLIQKAIIAVDLCLKFESVPFSEIISGITDILDARIKHIVNNPSFTKEDEDEFDTVFWNIYEFAKRSRTIIHAISNQLILITDTLEHIAEIYIRNSK